MDKILFEQVPDLFSSIGNLFVEKKEDLQCKFRNENLKKQIAFFLLFIF